MECYTRKKIAEKMGKPPKTITQWLNGFGYSRIGRAICNSEEQLQRFLLRHFCGEGEHRAVDEEPKGGRR